MGRFHFVDLGTITFLGLFEGLNDVFWGQHSIKSAIPLHTIIHSKTFAIVQKSPQTEPVCKSYASYKLTYPINHHGNEWIPCQLLFLRHLELVKCGFLRTF